MSSSVLGLPCLPGDKVHSAAFEGATIAFILPTLLVATDARGTGPSLNHGATSSGANRKGCQYPATTSTHTIKNLKVRASLIISRQKYHVRV